jgi:hypothetical protein
LDTLSADNGWKTVLQLGYVSPGVTTSGGAFNASGPFTIFVVCEGVGSLDIEYPPIGGSGYTCGATQQRDQNQIGSVQGLPADGLVHVTVTADSGVVWRALIEEQS